jgi:hypothetical protein
VRRLEELDRFSDNVRIVALVSNLIRRIRKIDQGVIQMFEKVKEVASLPLDQKQAKRKRRRRTKKREDHLMLVRNQI